MDDEHITIGFWMAICSVLSMIHAFLLYSEPCKDISEFFGETVCTGAVLYTPHGIFGLIIGFIIGMFFVVFSRANENESNTSKSNLSKESILGPDKSREQKKMVFSPGTIFDTINPKQSAKEESKENKEIIYQKYLKYPGWLWDTVNKKWVPVKGNENSEPPPAFR